MIPGSQTRLVAGGMLLFVWSLVTPAAAPAQQWEHLSPRERYDTMQKYREYENLPPERKEALDERYERWRKLPDAKREKVLRNYRRYQQMPPSERKQFNRKYNRWREDSRPKRERHGDGGRPGDRPKKKNKNR